MLVSVMSDSNLSPTLFPTLTSKESTGHRKSSNTGIIIGAAAGGSVLLLLALLVGIYAFRQKRRAEIADKQNNPFGKIRS